MLIQKEGDVDIRLGDVAEIEIGTTELNSLDRYNQDQVVFVGVYPEPGTSEIVVGDALYKAVAEINESLPPDLDLFIPFDNSRYMREAVAEIFSTLGETILLVGLVVLALMGSARSALVPLLTIPISILGATAAISLIGFSMNLLTILAIVLSVGLVVDDAIVVVENVARNLREGMSRKEAARLFSSATLPHHCHDDDAGGGVCADRIPVWSLRGVISGVRLHVGGGRADLRVCRHDPVSDHERLGVLGPRSRDENEPLGQWTL